MSTALARRDWWDFHPRVGRRRPDRRAVEAAASDL